MFELYTENKSLNGHNICVRIEILIIKFFVGIIMGTHDRKSPFAVA